MFIFVLQSIGFVINAAGFINLGAWCVGVGVCGCVCVCVCACMLVWVYQLEPVLSDVLLLSHTSKPLFSGWWLGSLAIQRADSNSSSSPPVTQALGGIMVIMGFFWIALAIFDGLILFRVCWYTQWGHAWLFCGWSDVGRWEGQWEERAAEVQTSHSYACEVDTCWCASVHHRSTASTDCQVVLCRRLRKRP